MFEGMTRFIPELENANNHFGEWIHNLDENGLPHSFSYVRYIKPVYDIHEALFQFYREYPEFEMKDFLDIIKENGISSNFQSVCGADCANKDAQCMIALLYFAAYSEKWDTGVLLQFYESGCILRWLKRLREIDEHNEFQGRKKT